MDRHIIVYCNRLLSQSGYIFQWNSHISKYFRIALVIWRLGLYSLFKTRFCICLFALGFHVLLEKISLMWRRFDYLRRAANVDLYSALIVTEQRGLFMWHGTSLLNGHLREPVANTPVTTIFYDLGLSRMGFEHQTHRKWVVHSNWVSHQRGHDSTCITKLKIRIPGTAFNWISVLTLTGVD